MMLGFSSHASVALMSLVLIAACGDDGATPADSSVDSATDSSADVGTDGASDSGGDTSVDAAGDASPDASDAAPDASDGAADACLPPACAAPPTGCRYEGSGPCVCGTLVCEGTPCTVDSECAGGFCRPLMSGGMACHPYAAEGDSCGGFVAAWAQERCDPSTNSCLPESVLIADAPGRCVVPATIAELRTSPESYRGRTVGVSASWVAAGLVGCTAIACAPAMPCCNSCSGGMVARDSETATESVGLATDTGTDYSCTGDECTLSCTVTQDRMYRITGEFDGTRILVTSIAPSMF